jgi:hypothetical protein
MEKLNFTDLKVEKERRFNLLIDKSRMFFAFSNDQFRAGLEKIGFDKETEKIVSIGHGGYMPKSEVENYLSGAGEINAWFKGATKSMKEEHILYELNNHECFYTGSIEYAKQVLPYSKKDIIAVYQKHRANYEH